MICRIPDATLPKESSRRDKTLEVYYQLLAVKDEVAKSIAESTFLEGVWVGK
jgi:hypothetical protein